MNKEIRKSIVIDAPVETVYKALSDEKELVNWFPDHAILEKSVGGRMEFKFKRSDGTVDHKVEGEILEIVPGKKLAFSWRNTSDPNFPNTKVTWSLKAVDGGRTRVELVHTGFSEGRWLDLHDGGWSFFIRRLAEYCTQGRVESRAMYKEMGKEIHKTLIINTGPEVVFRALTEGNELTQWFSNQGATIEPRTGGKLEFGFLRPDGERHAFHGRILEFIPAKKLSFSWNNIHEPISEDEIITWSLERVDGGKTKVTLSHTGLKESKEDIAAGWSYEAGWTYFLGQLVGHCNKLAVRT
jgi:uncharacterized protein YndB with AHSA1/START domain